MAIQFSTIAKGLVSLKCQVKHKNKMQVAGLTYWGENKALGSRSCDSQLICHSCQYTFHWLKVLGDEGRRITQRETKREPLDGGYYFWKTLASLDEEKNCPCIMSGHKRRQLILEERTKWSKNSESSVHKMHCGQRIRTNWKHLPLTFESGQSKWQRQRQNYYFATETQGYTKIIEWNRRARKTQSNRKEVQYFSFSLDWITSSMFYFSSRPSTLTRYSLQGLQRLFVVPLCTWIKAKSLFRHCFSVNDRWIWANVLQLVPRDFPSLSFSYAAYAWPSEIKVKYFLRSLRRNLAWQTDEKRKKDEDNEDAKKN